MEIDFKNVERIVKILIPTYTDPLICDLEIKEEKVFHEQTTTEKCVVCYVYKYAEEIEEYTMNHWSTNGFKLVFPEYYLNLTDKEIIKDVKERIEDNKDYLFKKFKRKNKKLNIQIDLKVNKEEYKALVDLVQKSDLCKNIKKNITLRNWDIEYKNTLESFSNHFDCIFHYYST